MALANGVRFIWLDTYIGQEEEYNEFKRMFRAALEPTDHNATGRNRFTYSCFRLKVLHHFYSLILLIKQLTLIKKHHDKKIIFISSGSLGKDIIPSIIARILKFIPFIFSVKS